VVCGISFGFADNAYKVNSYRTSRASVADTVTFFRRLEAAAKTPVADATGVFIAKRFDQSVFKRSGNRFASGKRVKSRI
jgi:hypothetical protein